ncbi:MAG: fimbrial biogenesis outer membrane usher protein [Gammaproteobacteria bacterium]|nr:fimbrial biogenesis outer membrane usher protein [Gammaproteobacteria bacterium]
MSIKRHYIVVFLIYLLCSFFSITIFAYDEAIYQIVLNRQDFQHISLVIFKNNLLYIPVSEIEKWHLRKMPAFKVSVFDGERYCALSSLPGASYKIDSENLILYIMLPSSVFEKSRLNVSGRTSHIVEPPRSSGAFFNYDVQAEHLAPQNDSEKSSVGSMLEGGYFSPYGVGQTNFLYRSEHSEGADKFVRLNTSWVYDNTSDMRRVKFGDVTTGFGMFNRSLYFGGIQIERNFNLQPDKYVHPLPSMISGSAVVPSTVDLYLDNARIFNRSVAPGPFDIDSFPVVNGKGTLKVVTKDVLGNEKVINIPYYYTQQLLNPGVHRYLFDAGFVRRDFALKNFDYGDPLINMSDDVGVTKNLTVGLRGSMLWKSQAVVGSEINFLPKNHIGVFSLDVMGSRRNNGALGSAVDFGFSVERRKWYFNASTKFTTSRYTELGYEKDDLLPSWQAETRLSRSFGSYGSASIAYIGRTNRDDNPTSKFVTVQYAASIKDWNLSILAMDDLGKSGDRAFLINFSRNFGEHDDSLNLGASLKEGAQKGSVSLSRNLGYKSGWGYQVASDLESSSNSYHRVYGRLNYQNGVGRYNAEIVNQNKDMSYRLQALGGMLYFKRHLFLTRSSSSSFGLVEVPNYPNVGVYRGGEVIEHTDKEGYAIVPNLTPYYPNKIGINLNDMPRDIIIDKDRINVYPYYRSPAIVKFVPKKIRAVEFRPLMPDGKEFPLYSLVKAASAQDESFVDEGGIVNTEIYQDILEGTVTTDDKVCSFSYKIPAKEKEDKDFVYELGNIKTTDCKEKPLEPSE